MSEPAERYAEAAWQIANDVVAGTACRSGDAAAAAVSRAAAAPPDIECALLMIGAFVVPMLIKGHMWQERPSPDALRRAAHRLASSASGVVELREDELFRLLNTTYGEHGPDGPMQLARFVLIGFLVLGFLLEDPISELEKLREWAVDYAVGELRNPSLDWRPRRQRI